LPSDEIFTTRGRHPDDMKYDYDNNKDSIYKYIELQFIHALKRHCAESK